MLKENLEIIKSTFLDYNGTGMYLAIYLIALLYIFICEKNKKIKAFTLYFSLIMLFITLNPVFNKLLGKIFTKSIYWRIYWMLPIGLVIAYVITKIIKERDKKSEKIIIFLASITIIIVSGKFIYTKENYIKVNNLYKIPDEAVEVTKIISEDNEETKKVMPPTSLAPYIRQINSNIGLMYARQPSSYEKVTIVKELEQGNVDNVTNQCKKQNCNYIIFNKTTPLNGNMQENGYSLFAQTENYNIYKLNKGMEITIIGGSNMKEKENTNSCGYIIKNNKNELIIVDGGTEADADDILDYIEKYGQGTVKYWYITHAHSDHVGALVSLLNNQDVNIKIENLCYKFNDIDWYEKYDKRGYETELAMINALKSEKIINKIECNPNQIIEMDNINCKILRVANPNITNSDNGNETSMVFKMTATDVNKSIIFLGDSFTYTSKELLENCKDDLKSGAVQMAHHGQNGVAKEVYEAINPEICFFNCPEWLWNNDNGGGYNSGKWKTIEVRKWMEEMNTTNIVAYEGNQTIRLK